MRSRIILVVIVLLTLGLAVVPAQSTSTQIQVAINNLITGITTFTTERLTAGRYILWGTGTDAAGYGLRDNAGVIEVKSSGGAWTPIVTGATLPTNASFITRVSESALTNETALGSLATAILVNTTTTGVPTAYAGTSCTNQFPRSLSAIGAATCASVSLTADVTGTLPVANGGTGMTSGTSGGILGFTASGTIASSGALTANALVLGGGAGSTPTALGSLGTTTTLLHGNAGGAPTFAAASLTADVSGILPTANGGTGIAYFTAAGPTVARVYTFPDAAATVLTTNAAVTAAQGGTGQTSYAVGDLLQASASTTLTKLAAVATGNVLISGGVTTVSSWGKVGLTTHVSGTLAVGNGGTGKTSYTTGDVVYASSGSTLAGLADVTAGSLLRSGGVATAPVWSTTTWPNAATTGDLILATGTNAMGSLSDVAVNRVLVSGGVGVVPAYSTAPVVATIQGTTSVTAGSALALGTTSTDGIISQNTTAATGAVQVQISPRTRYRGNAWDTAASETVDFFWENLPAAAGTPTGTMKLGYILNGAAATYPWTMTSAGVSTTLAGGSYAFSGRTIMVSSADGLTAHYDSTSTHAVQINSATSAPTFNNGTIAAHSTSTAGSGTLTGGNTGGTVTFTPGFTNAPFCVVEDITTKQAIQVTSTTSNTMVIAGATANDNFHWICLGGV